MTEIQIKETFPKQSKWNLQRKQLRNELKWAEKRTILATRPINT